MIIINNCCLYYCICTDGYGNECLRVIMRGRAVKMVLPIAAACRCEVRTSNPEAKRRSMPWALGRQTRCAASSRGTSFAGRGTARGSMCKAATQRGAGRASSANAAARDG